MNRLRAARHLTAIGSALLVSSCAWVPSYVSELGVTIERTATSTGIVSSAHFWEDGQGFSLRDEITPRPITKGPLGGHVDLAITSPDSESIACTTTRQQIRVCHVRKPLSLRFDESPTPGSVVQVKHHDSANHEHCDV